MPLFLVYNVESSGVHRGLCECAYCEACSNLINGWEPSNLSCLRIRPGRAICHSKLLAEDDIFLHDSYLVHVATFECRHPTSYLNA